MAIANEIKVYFSFPIIVREELCLKTTAQPKVFAIPNFVFKYVISKWTETE